MIMQLIFPDAESLRIFWKYNVMQLIKNVLNPPLVFLVVVTPDIL